MTLSSFMDGLLVLLLAATVVYCALLEHRLRSLREDQAALDRSLRAFTGAIGTAQSSLSGLRLAAQEVGEILSHQISGARAITDELSVLTASGERIAGRIEMGSSARSNSYSQHETLRAVR